MKWAWGPMLVLGGCHASDRYFVDSAVVPEDIAWLAAVPARPGVGSPLVAREDLTALPALELEPAGALLVGFRPSDLPALSPGETALDRQDPLRTAEDRSLPTPPFVAFLENPDRKAELEYELGADWLPPCPELVRNMEAVVDAKCNACIATASQTECSLELDLRACGSNSAVFQVAGSGRLESVGGARCEVLDETPPGASASVRCGSNQSDTCRADLYLPGESKISTKTKLLFEPSPHAPLPPPGLGLMGDLAILTNGELVVSTFDGAFESEYICRAGKGKLLFLDGDSLDVIREIETPECPTKLEALEDGSFLLVSGSPQVLEKRDRDGAVTASLVIPRDEIERRAKDIEILGNEVYLVSVGDKTQVGAVHVIDLERFTVTATRTVDRQVEQLLKSTERVYAVSDAVDAVIDITGEEPRTVATAAGTCLASSMNLNGVARDEESGDFIVSSDSDTPFLYRVQNGTCLRGSLPGTLAEPKTLLSFGSRFLVALEIRGSGAAVLAYFNAEVGSFEPWFESVGSGRFDRLIGRGDVAWGLLREEGRVVRAQRLD